MIEASDELLTISELAIGLAGFAGVVVAFADRGELRQSDRYRFIGLFSQALTVALLSFVPFGFHHAGQVGGAIWRASSGVAIVFFLFHAWLIGVRVRPEFSSAEAVPRFAAPTLSTLAMINLLLQLMNLAGWPLAPGPLLYLIGLLLWLTVPAFFFATLVLYRVRE